MTKWFKLSKVPVAVCMVSWVCVGSADAQVTTPLSSFTGANGSGSQGQLIRGSDGNLYGTTSSGGASARGTVFKLSPTTGVITTLYSFCTQESCADGAEPQAALLQATDGNFYGTTFGGGNGGSGTIFKMTATGVLTTLYSFCTQANCGDGAFPLSALIEGTDGNFYGTTPRGGVLPPGSRYPGNSGTIFVMTPAGVLTTLYTFCGYGCGDGAQPSALVQTSNGSFYGTTASGGDGINPAGTFFSFTPSNGLTTLYTFDCREGDCPGSSPTGVIQGLDGNFYGTTASGGAGYAGTVFKITPSGALTTLHSFCALGADSCLDGLNPVAPLLQGMDGNFYGATTYGGGPGIVGTVFKVTPQGLLSTLHRFCAQGPMCPDGSLPQAGLVQSSSGLFYGTTIDGGRDADGTVFSLFVAGTGANSVALSAQADYFGTMKASFTVYRPSTGYWYSIDGAGRSSSLPWGASTDIPLIGDFDGDGKSDLAVWRPSNGYFYIVQSSSNQVVAQQWGTPTDAPVVGDFDGDGKTDIAVYRPSTGVWFIRQSSDAQVVVRQWGESADMPVIGDFDGDGRSDVAVWRPSTGYWYVIESSDDEIVATQWGENGDIPVPGDYDGDGKTDFAVYRPSSGCWFVLQSGTGNSVSQCSGQSGDIPVARDYDGDGKVDIALWRPSTGTWYVFQSSTGTVVTRAWGAPTDIPVDNPAEHHQ